MNPAEYSAWKKAHTKTTPHKPCWAALAQEGNMPKYNLIEEEIKWCKAHRNPKEKKYQDGFISGLEHALWLMKSRPTPRAADAVSKYCNCTWPEPQGGYFCVACNKPRR